MTQMTRHKNQTGQGRLTDLPALRVTSLAQFEDCPATWKAKFIDGIEQKDSKYGTIGTAVHSIIEHFLTKGWDTLLNPTPELVKMWELVPTNERAPLREYITTLSLREGRVLALEYEFTIQMFEGMIPIRGHIDMLSEEDATTICITDHKTNRQLESKQTWQGKMQQLLYAWAVRRLFPQYTKVKFAIGYVNFNRIIEWDTDPLDDEALGQRIWRIWQDMLAHDSTGKFPAIFNDNCGWCPIKESCVVYKASVTDFAEAVLTLAQKPIHERFLFIRAVKKAVETAEAELKEELSAKIEANNGSMVIDDITFTYKYEETRKADYLPVSSALNSWVGNHLDDWAEIAPYFEDTFTVKVGGLDKLMAKYPDLKSIITPLVNKRANENKTLRVKQPASGKKRLTS